MKLTHFLNLPNKVALSTLVLICAGFLPLIYFTTTRLEADLGQLLFNQQRASVNYVANDLEQKILLRKQALQDVADAIPLEKLHDRAAMSAYLEKRLAIYRLFTYGVLLIGADGKGIADYPRVAERGSADYSTLEYFREVMATGEPAMGKPRLGRFTHKPGLGIAVPLKDAQGRIRGVMVGIVSLTDRSVFDQTHAALGKSGEYVVLSPRDRMVIIDSDNSDMMRGLPEIGQNPALDLLVEGHTGAVMVDGFHRMHSLATARTIMDGRWVVIGLLPVTEAFAPLHELKADIYLMAGIVLLLIVGLVAWLIHYQLRPLTRATQVLKNMVQQGTPLRNLPVESDDEVGQLLATFNQLQQELQASHQEVYERKEFLRSIFENEPECVKVVARNGELLDMNRAGLAMLEVQSLEEAKAYGLSNFLHPEYRTSFFDLHRKVCEGGSGVLEFQIVGKQGTPLWLETHASPLCDVNGQVIGQISITRDVTERRVLQQALEHQAQIDYLTELPNRRRFMELAEQELARSLRYHKALSIFMVDIDHFKRVNDTHGHKTGDVVLQKMSALMQESLREIDMIGRLGGEEFAVLLPETALDEARDVAERLRARVAEEEFVLEEGMPLRVTISVGVATMKQKNLNIDMLLSVADEALYKAKHAGRNQVCVA